MLKVLLVGDSTQIIRLMDSMPAVSEIIRPAIFVALLLLFSALERAWPLRLSDPQRPLRWLANFGLVAIGTVLISVLKLSLLAGAVWAEQSGFGLFNLVDAPWAVELVLAWLLLDLAIYAQHRAFHELPALWPLHRVHHSDVEFDVTTGLRFHPAELLASQLFKIAVIVLLGAPWLAVLLFEIGLSSFSLFTHANLRLPAGLERALRLVIVTPDMHRIHHSTHRDEHDSNYGNLLSVWDRVLRSYTATAREHPREMRIGLGQFRAPASQTLPALLTQPLE